MGVGVSGDVPSNRTGANPGCAMSTRNPNAPSMMDALWAIVIAICGAAVPAIQAARVPVTAVLRPI